MGLYASALLCVIGLAVGQILFKLSAAELSHGEVLYNYKALTFFLFAVIIYGVTSIGWVYILRSIELGRIYPLMALAFILVPAGSYFVLGERFQPQYYIGVVLIVVGIIVAVRS